MKRQTWILGLLAMVLVCYSGYRAGELGIVHDEALTLKHYVLTDVVIQDQVDSKSANNHWLNTLIMHYEYKAFGLVPFALRVHSVMAHVIFLLFLILSIRALKLRMAGYFLFFALALNPFILDFFSLARGYALAIAFFMASLYFLIRAINRFKPLYVFLAVAFLSLSVLANFTYVNVLVLVLAMFLIRLVLNRKELTGTGKAGVVTVLLLGVCYIGILIPQLLKLKEAGALYFGSDNISDMIYSLVATSLYEREKDSVLLAICSIGVVLVVGWSLFQGVKKWVTTRVSPLSSVQGSISFLFVGIIAVNLFQHMVLDVNLYSDRTGMFLLPLGVMLIALVLDRFHETKKQLSNVIVGLLCVLCAGNMGHAINFTHTCLWQYDADMEQVVTFIANHSQQHVNRYSTTVRSDYHYHPSFEYYVFVNEQVTLNMCYKHSKYQGLADYLIEPMDSVKNYLEHYVPIDTMVISKAVIMQRKAELHGTLLAHITATDYGNREMVLDKERGEVLRVGPMDEFSGTLVLDTIAPNKTWLVSWNGWVYRPTLFNRASLVISHETRGGEIFWEQVLLNQSLFKQGWNEVNRTWAIPAEHEKTGTLKVYIWNPEGSELWLDDPQMKVLAIDIN